MSGRHTGTFSLPDAEIPPTGETMPFSTASIVRIADGRIPSRPSDADHAPTAQLGLVTEPSAGMA